MIVLMFLCFGIFVSVTEGKTKACVHGTFSPHPTECSMYQVCVHGHQMNMTCVYGTAWDQKTSSCVDAAEKGCKIKDKSSDSFSCPSTFGQFPDPKDCTKYYVCSFGTATAKQCLKNTGWDPKLKLCNYLSNLPKCPP
ncbi:peritrophin-1-like [Ostrea edulis]|uniref:peritrophin-1-like n=1 Tax=Ostrea edulis TaxID=37623 RepID=UPI0024AFE9FE|nr:peritrophin-1-like [Ostrea edulis]